MDLERRKHPRTKPAKLSYIRFNQDNGGVVLDASIDGLSFQTVGPIDPSSTVKLTISPSVKTSISASGRIIWTDDSGKKGGLEFLNVPVETADLLNSWLSQPAPAETADVVTSIPDAPGTILEETSQSAIGVPGEDYPAAPAPLRPAHSAPPAATPSPIPSASSFVPSMFAGVTQAPALHELSPFELTAQPARPRFVRGVATGIIVAVLILLPLMYVFNFRQEFGRSLIRLGERIVSAPPSQTQADQPVTPPDKQPENRQADVAPSATNPAASQTSSSDSAAAAQPQPIPPPDPSDAQTSAPPDTPSANAESSPARRPQATPPAAAFTSSTPTTPDELWTAVSHGDTNSEVALARLYLTGHGVPKSCKQARVLLQAASQKGNQDAINELRRVLIRGCP